MGRLTETEIFGCLTENFRLAAEAAEKLAVSPIKGPAYRQLIKSLGLVEGAARQAAHWRGDTRFLKIGMQAAHIHKRAGDWLRGVKVPGAPTVKIAAEHQHPLFRKLAEVMLAALAGAIRMQFAATQRLGPILPEMMPVATRTQDRQMQVMLPPGMMHRPSGLIVPETVH